MIRVAVVEDMTVLREALVAVLNSVPDIQVTAALSRGDQVAALVQHAPPEVLLLDVELPGRDGLTVAADLRTTAPHTRILMLSVLDRPGVVHQALAAGVAGFLPKGVSMDRLLDSIHRVHAGESVFPPGLLSTALRRGQNPLTSRETLVLRLMADGDSAKEVSRRLGLVAGTVQNHMTRVLHKLGARNKVEAIRIATDNGWLTG
ncbi:MULTISPECIES: response regulator transcription factor [unclassified Crossiella]|uniref:response regulator n=1 Tax=unclassified Crossiella TaxID=2620835 RepID=UPI001FFF610C|nr:MULTISPECIES: response regulator transcription factor [unclassified Crossiella]MCK2239632.1 response regulator transcription factor [Crossiella sp. S99.2]MCK2252327.1 response regulator transcription factor [Crossiella sp. S99.1]